MFINVNTESLKELEKSISLKDSRRVKIKRDIIKTRTVKKYLFISLILILMLENNNLFIKTFLGRLNERIWFNEYLVNEYIFKNLNPEPVEKKEPPIITNIK